MHAYDKSLMKMVNLDQKQKERIGKYIEQFKERLKTELSEAGWEKERRERTVLFQKLLAEQNIGDLTEREISRG